MAALVAAQQADPARHVAYESMAAAAIASELAELEPAGLDGLLVAVDGEEVVGALGAEWDERPPRVWWHGPYAAVDDEAWPAVAAALLDAGRTLLPASVEEEELAPDDRHALLARLAARRGFTGGEASAVLSAALPVASPPPVEGVVLRPFAEDDRAAVAALHDPLFPDTHLPGDRLDQGRDRVVVVAEARDGIAGYAALERQTDGAGYLDFLGVDPAWRGRGLGRALVAGACARLVEVHGCRDLHLTVRESNAVARALYAALGFTEERLIRPWRRGFRPE